MAAAGQHPPVLADTATACWGSWGNVSTFPLAALLQLKQTEPLASQQVEGSAPALLDYTSREQQCKRQEHMAATSSWQPRRLSSVFFVFCLSH